MNPQKRPWTSSGQDDDPVIAVLGSVADRLDKLADEISDNAVERQSGGGNGGGVLVPVWLMTAFLGLLSVGVIYALGAEGRMRAYHDARTPPANVEQALERLDARDGDFEQRLRSLERSSLDQGGNP